MAVQVMDKGQILPIESHLDLALGLEPDEVEAIRILATQLENQAVLPILGAGASHDCGVRVAGKIAVDLYAECSANGLGDRLKGVADSDLGGIAEAIYIHHGDSHQAVLDAIGMPDPDRWPGTPEVDPHFCALRILARGVREHEGLSQAFSFNYDCCGEAALQSEGFSLTRETTAGLIWLDHAEIFCSKEMYQGTGVKKGFKLVKAHGCAEHYREAYEKDECEAVAEAIVIRAEQIATWEERLWGPEGVERQGPRPHPAPSWFFRTGPGNGNRVQGSPGGHLQRRLRVEPTAIGGDRPQTRYRCVARVDRFRRGS